MLNSAGGKPDNGQATKKALNKIRSVAAQSAEPLRNNSATSKEGQSRRTGITKPSSKKADKKQLNSIHDLANNQSSVKPPKSLVKTNSNHEEQNGVVKVDFSSTKKQKNPKSPKEKKSQASVKEPKRPSKRTKELDSPHQTNIVAKRPSKQHLQMDARTTKTASGARDSLVSKLEAKMNEERQYFYEMISQMGNQIKELERVVAELKAEKAVTGPKSAHQENSKK